MHALALLLPVGFRVANVSTALVHEPPETASGLPYKAFLCVCTAVLMALWTDVVRSLATRPPTLLPETFLLHL